MAETMKEIVLTPSKLSAYYSRLCCGNSLNLRFVEKLGDDFDFNTFMKLRKTKGVDYAIGRTCEGLYKRMCDEFNRDYLQFCSLKWMTDNPETQLCGSFNPSFSNPEIWYDSETPDTYIPIEEFEGIY
jgi:hypothetical protein